MRIGLDSYFPASLHSCFVLLSESNLGLRFTCIDSCFVLVNIKNYVDLRASPAALFPIPSVQATSKAQYLELLTLIFLRLAFCTRASLVCVCVCVCLSGRDKLLC